MQIRKNPMKSLGPCNRGGTVGLNGHATPAPSSTSAMAKEKGTGTGTGTGKWSNGHCH